MQGHRRLQPELREACFAGQGQEAGVINAWFPQEDVTDFVLNNFSHWQGGKTQEAEVWIGCSWSHLRCGEPFLWGGEHIWSEQEDSRLHHGDAVRLKDVRQHPESHSDLTVQ